MELKGTIKQIFQRQDVSGTFSKREFVITTQEQYPQHILMEFTQDKCDLLDKYQVGKSVKVSINVRGREWVNPQGETKYFNTLQAWRIEADGQAQTPTPGAPAAPQQQVYVHTNTQYTEAALKQQGWSEEALVEKGFGHFQPASAPKAPAAPAPNNDIPF